MPESLAAWWSRRRWSKGVDVPYAAGEFSEYWSVLRRAIDAYDPRDNDGVLLSQIPPAADVFLVWHCLLDHEWVATPAEQVARAGRGVHGRDRSCPVCSAPPPRLVAPASPGRGAVPAGGRIARHEQPEPRALGRRRPGDRREDAGAAESRTPDPLPPAKSTRAGPPQRGRAGDAFAEPGRRLATSAAEGELRALLAARLEFTPGLTAIRVAQPFHGRHEVRPDVVLPELRIALEYDTPGRIGDEHVGSRERSDRRKDDLLRRVGWEVVRIRCGGLAPLGPFDLCAAGVSAALVERLLEGFARIRGDLIVAAYRRPPDIPS